MAQLENLCAEHGLPRPDRELYLKLAKGKEVNGLRIRMADFNLVIRRNKFKKGA